MGQSREQWFVDDLDWQPINKSQQMHVCAPFSEQEIRTALLSISNNKAPGPDSFTMEFFKKSWNSFKPNILEVCFKTFFQNGVVNNNVNETYIELIAKKEKCYKATNFGPIGVKKNSCRET